MVVSGKMGGNFSNSIVQGICWVWTVQSSGKQWLKTIRYYYVKALQLLSKMWKLFLYITRWLGLRGYCFEKKWDQLCLSSLIRRLFWIWYSQYILNSGTFMFLGSDYGFAHFGETWYRGFSCMYQIDFRSYRYSCMPVNNTFKHHDTSMRKCFIGHRVAFSSFTEVVVQGVHRQYFFRYCYFHIWLNGENTLEGTVNAR